MSGIWLPVRPADPPATMNLDQLIASAIRYGAAPDRCPLCGNTGVLSIGFVGTNRGHAKFECGTEVGLGFLSRGDNCHWEIKT